MPGNWEPWPGKIYTFITTGDLGEVNLVITNKKISIPSTLKRGILVW
jgi:hypothetical protein